MVIFLYSLNHCEFGSVPMLLLIGTNIERGAVRARANNVIEEPDAVNAKTRTIIYTVWLLSCYASWAGASENI